MINPEKDNILANLFAIIRAATMSRREEETPQAITRLGLLPSARTTRARMRFWRTTGTRKKLALEMQLMR